MGKAVKNHVLQPGLSRSMKQAEKAARHPRIYCLQYAKNGRSACHACGGRIDDGQLRFGLDVSAEHWPSQPWFHWGCMKEEQLREVGGAERILKLDPLRPQDKEAVEQRFAQLK